MTAAWGPLDRLVGRAEALAGAWGARARASTTTGQERAILRLFGVHGGALDRLDAAFFALIAGYYVWQAML